MHKIICFQPLDTTYASYQLYYQQGLIDYLGREQLQFLPTGINLGKLLSNKNIKRFDYYLISRIFKRRSLILQPFCEKTAVHVGQYIMHSSDGREIKFAIDTHDHREIYSPAILEWSDIYFKSNRWEDYPYPKKIHPIVNGNGSVTPKSVKQLISLRNSQKELDLVFISRIWGSGDHDIPLFEEISKLKCKKKLLAIFPKPRKEKQRLMQYKLDKAEIPWTYRYVPQKKLWDMMGKAKIIVLRVGQHLCIPWRMIDLLAMGACILYDNDPYPSWPIPLRNNINYVSLNLPSLSADHISQNDYTKIPEVVKNLLANDSSQNVIRENNRHYFDLYASPKNIAEYIINVLLLHTLPKNFKANNNAYIYI